MSRIGSEVEAPRRRARRVMLGFGLIVIAGVGGLIVLLLLVAP